MNSDNSIPSAKKDNVLNIGVEQNFDYFFRQYYVALCFFANSIIHNDEDAKDIVQDCFIKFWSNDIVNEKVDIVKSFLYTMVRNRCIDYTRKQKTITKTKSILLKSEEEFEHFDELVFAEMMRQIFDQIEELPETMKTILKKYYFEGKKYKEIAAEMNTTPDAVRMQKTRAIKILKQKLPPHIGLLLMFLLQNLGQ
ncbi:RNA polymerase sigma-70 factor [Parafilimonas sp.]|uniref:RNA polymerase sigma-70 factor n=1 Tax=Parafilimonas sp. TaxID=1969739 RepID=UPI003F7E368D